VSLVPLLAVLIASAGGALLYVRHRVPQPAMPTEAVSAGVDATEAARLAEGNREVLELYRAGKLREGMKKVDLLIKAFPGRAELHVNSAMIRSRMGQLQSARKDLEAALRFDPKNATALNNLGVLDLGQKLLIPAIENLKTAVEVAPTYATARLNYAKALELAGRREDAVREYQQGVNLVASDPLLANLLRKRIQKLQEAK
jgi:tetratricopeptide (TPR) repeat protein